ncbi:hypothetical protein BCL69_100836 [Nitrosomonas communis]|uniref:Uncharacterized protein n=1 Tax=Nitrosomonas communis TaxID=44574 RepID=A0A5D3YFF1_9PROT|nr:hypothetical protein BCL69_100836 [Nitrosomonas communis]
MDKVLVSCVIGCKLARSQYSSNLELEGAWLGYGYPLLE